MSDSGHGKRSRTIPPGAALAARIVDAALAAAEDVGWDRLRLRLVAERLGVPAAEVAAVYRDIDAVADAWFARALAAMLQPPPAGFAEMMPEERLHLLLMRWFDALAPHRRITGQMLRTKLYPSHPHHWLPMVFSLSRLINWLRDAALLDAGGRRRRAEELGLTALFVATLAVWQRDGSPDQARTREFLRRRLAEAGRAMRRLYGD